MVQGGAAEARASNEKAKAAQALAKIDQKKPG